MKKTLSIQKSVYPLGITTPEEWERHARVRANHKVWQMLVIDKEITEEDYGCFLTRLYLNLSARNIQLPAQGQNTFRAKGVNNPIAPKNNGKGPKRDKDDLIVAICVVALIAIMIATQYLTK